MDVIFEWDEDKNRLNKRKHGFDFDDAPEVFEGDMLRILDDRDGYGEDRWLGFGVFRGAVVVIVFTEPDDETIRIISMRRANRYERGQYEEAYGV